MNTEIVWLSLIRFFSDNSPKQLDKVTLCLLGHAFHNLCLRRRELQKPDVAWKYGNIFNADVENNQWLYGGKAQFEEMIKDIGTTNKVAREMKPNFKYVPQPSVQI